MSERERASRSDEGRPEVEAHRLIRHDEDVSDRGLTPEERAGESREDDEPDVETHQYQRRRI